MDPIIPEKDELDRFQHARGGSGRSGVSQSDQVKSAEKLGGKQPAGGKTLKLSKPAAAALVVLFLLVVVLMGMGYWQVSSQQETIKTLNEQLEDASQYISQSKLVIARLEGQINQTDATMAQSGNEMARELKFLDSEVRKLWDVSNKRNRRWIEDLQKEQKALKSSLEQVDGLAQGVRGEVNGLIAVDERLTQQLQTQALAQETLSDAVERLDGAQSVLSDTLAKLDADLAKSMQDVQAIAGERAGAVQQEVASVQASLKSQQSELSSLKDSMQALRRSSNQQDVTKRVVSMESTLQNLDRTRNQLVQRFVELDARISELQIQLNALK